MSVAMVTLGCARNEVDSEELAGRLAADGFRLVDDPEDADTVVVNTCGFVEAAKKDSVDTLLEAADLKETGRTQAVVAVGCMAERYGKDLAQSLPEADAVLGFDDYPEIADRLRSVLAGETLHPHTPQDRRKLLPITPAERDASTLSVPGHQPVASVDDVGAGGPATGPRAVRRRLGSGPTAPLKLASGCDRRCTFCAIPAFRGAFVSRRPSDVLQEAQWLATQDVKEIFLVSENSTSYGKDLGDLRLLETMLPELSAIEGIERVRVSYLQPAETRPGLIEAIATTPGVVPYFDLSFQHASATVLRRMRRFGDPESFLGLLQQIRALRPDAGVRSNVIVGFPGETEEEFRTLCDFLVEARLDVTGVFGYSDEDGTAAEQLPGKLDADLIAERTAEVSALVEELNAQRAEDRIGDRVSVLVESLDDGVVEGRAEQQGPEVDGCTRIEGDVAALRIGDIVEATVIATEGVDLVAELGRDRDRSRGQAQQLEHPQRAHDSAHPHGAALRVGPAAGRR
ncbi:30S ribosomal protein S12 methylthiotransferase RimO [Nocardioides alcanivorans]|uniref:30S ribosomal protein S12 methylthiotransferase RimO n=1 Tax=Nocardioides alcanivorans TaxID=2897352 RepID=UPI001F18970D|nr:30S ribosomal protein S12 methylthiotransferase RimO [Nocardioides alcanivorans]